MANELVARNGLRVSGSTFLGSVSLDQSLTSTVLALDPTTNEVNYLSLVSADVHITGGTLTGTGDKDLQLVNSTGGTITISDVNIQTTGGTYDSATGIVTFTQNDGNTYGVGGWSYVETVTESNNAITVTLNDTTQSLLQIDAVTGVTYNNDWDLALGGTGTISASPVELPFITGATFNAGTITLGINGGLESDITVDISALDTDIYATGGTLNGSTLTIDMNDGTNFDVTGFTWSLSADVGAETVDLGESVFIVGLTGIDTVVSAQGPNIRTVQINISDTGVVAGTYGSSSEVPVFDVNAQGQITGVTNTTIDGSAISNNTITFLGTAGTGSTVSLGGTLTYTSTDNSVVINSSNGTVDLSVGAGVDTYSTGGTISSGTLTIGLNDGTDFDVTGFEFLVGGDDASTITTTINGSFKISGGTGLNTTTNTVDTVTVNLDQPYFSSITESDNVVTVVDSEGNSSNFTIDAVTGVTYSSDWAVAFDGTGTLGTSPVELPFITGGTYDSGTSTITLGVNGGLESDIEITGLDGSDTYVTGVTESYQGVDLDRNDGNSVSITTEQTIRVAGSGASGTLFNVNPNVYQAVHVEYSMVEGAAARSGFFTAIFVGDQVEYADWSTVDLGTFTGTPELVATPTGDINFINGGPGLRIIANTRAVAI